MPKVYYRAIAQDIQVGQWGACECVPGFFNAFNALLLFYVKNPSSSE